MALDKFSISTVQAGCCGNDQNRTKDYSSTLYYLGMYMDVWTYRYIDMYTYIFLYCICIYIHICIYIINICILYIYIHVYVLYHLGVGQNCDLPCLSVTTCALLYGDLYTVANFPSVDAGTYAFLADLYGNL
jgi:hypothetical protein